MFTKKANLNNITGIKRAVGVIISDTILISLLLTFWMPQRDRIEWVLSRSDVLIICSECAWKIKEIKQRTHNSNDDHRINISEQIIYLLPTLIMNSTDENI